MQPFFLQLEASCLQLSFLLTLDKFSFCLQLELFCLQFQFLCLQWESVSNKGLKGLYAKKLNCKQKAPTVSKKTSPLFTGGGGGYRTSSLHAMGGVSHPISSHGDT